LLTLTIKAGGRLHTVTFACGAKNMNELGAVLVQRILWTAAAYLRTRC